VSKSESAKKAVRTKKLKKIGETVAKHRKELTVGVINLLKDWNKGLEGKKICVVCGDCVPETILQEHHINPYKKFEGKIWLCGSCHNIFNKAKITTTQNEIERDLKLRHERIKQKL
jgi:5-methylcytosine-specific restriction endonuclease McrA